MVSSPTRIRIERKSIEVPFFREKLAPGLQLNVTGLDLYMMQIPAGEFMMGSPEDELERLERESPQHRVTISSFFMAKYPVIQEQWEFVASRLPQVDIELKPNPSNFHGDKRPVEQVNWYEAVEFCQRLSNYTDRTYRLPSEAEWEYACRAGTITPFHFGETISTNFANYRGTDDESMGWKGNYGDGLKGEYREETTPVDRFGVANNFGLCDMHGNVWEWCLDHWHDNYKGAPTDGSVWIEGGNSDRRIARGGSWLYLPRICRSASRNNYYPDIRHYDFGFRVVCVP